MGADFLERTKKSFRRSWDRGRVALATSDLLTRQPECAGRSVVGEIINGQKISTGERLTVEKDERGLVARRGLTDVLRIPKPPSDVVLGIEQSCGVGVGTVEQVHGPAGTVEITIC